MKEGYHTPQNLQADKTSELQACVTLQGKGRMTLSAEQSRAVRNPRGQSHFSELERHQVVMVFKKTKTGC